MLKDEYQKTLIFSIAIKQALTSLAIVSIGLFPMASFARTLRLTETTITEVNQTLDQGAINSEQLVKLYLKRTETYEHHGPKINAIISINDNAIAQAIALDAKRRERVPLY